MNKWILILLLLPLAASAQDKQSDSLLAIFQQKSVPNGKRVEAAIALTAKWSTGRFAEADSIARLALPLAQMALQKGQLFTNQGRAQYFLGHYDQASALYHQALALLEPGGASPALGELYNVLGRLYRKTRQYSRAYAAYDQGLQVFETLKDSTGLSTIYNESGVVFEYEEKFAEAIARYQKAFAIQEAQQDKLGMSYSLNFMAGVRSLQGRHLQAVALNQQALSLRRLLADTMAIALVHSDLATSYYRANRPAEAQLHFDSSNLLARRMKYADLLMANLKQEASLASEAGKPQQAYQLLEEYAQLKDSVYKQQSAEAMEEMATKYETAKRNQLIADQALALRQRNWLLGLALAVLLLGAGLVWQWVQRQRQRKDFDLKQAVLAERKMAAEAVLQAEDAERRRIAAELHDGLGQMMSAAHMQLNALEAALPLPLAQLQERLAQTTRLVNLSCQDIRVVSHQTMPSALLNNHLGDALRNLSASLSGVAELQLYGLGELPEEALSPAHKATLFRVLQEGVNNALRHGGAQRITLTTLLESGELSLTLEDNGRGFHPGQQGDGIGMQNMRSRIKFLNGDIQWDAAPGRGTVLMIFLHLASQDQAQRKAA